MVTRKPSLPYPTSPPPPPPEFGPSHSSHDIDSTEVPPVPLIKKRPTDDSPYHDMGNPWQEDAASSGLDQKSQSVSVTEQLDRDATSTAPQPGDQQLPDILKPGWSGENTPRSSLDSDRSKDFWESSDDEDDKKPKQKDEKKTTFEESTPAKEHDIPAILQVRRKPVSPRVTQESGSTGHQQGFASNNPFRPQTQQGSSEVLDQWTHITEGKGKEKEVEQSHGLTQPGWDHSQVYGASSNIANKSETMTQFATSSWEPVPKAIPPIPQTQPPPVPPSAPPPVSIVPPTPLNEQPPLIPVETEQDHDGNPWTTSSQSISRQQSPLPNQKSVYSNDLLDRGSKGGFEGGLVSLDDELKSLPNHAPSAASQTSIPLTGISVPLPPQESERHEEADFFAPPPGPPPIHAVQQMSHQERPSLKPLTTAEIAEMNDQRNETYQIKHFRWFDHRTRKLRSSSMLTQNKNGPCPLLALVNALILGAQDQDQAALDEFLRTREQVTLGTIIENLMMELLAAAEDGELPDVDELNRFLLKLRTGMNMNPRFVQQAAPAPNLMDARNSMLHIPELIQQPNRPGTFEPSQDIRLYGAFGVQTVHGWLPEPGTDAASAFERTAQNYEDAQAKLFGEDELEYKLTRNGLTPEEQVIWEDIVSIKHFLQSNPTQLTHYGLHCIKSSMSPGSFSVLFRNDHFSTIYMHPRDGRLYSLITDAGYADRDEVIWESLVDTSGHETEFYSGDFKSVSQGGSQQAESTTRRPSDQYAGHDSSEDTNATLSPTQRQEQEDADLAMAIQLQEEEEQRDRQRRAQENTSTPQPNRQTGRRSTGNIPIPIRGSTGNMINSAQEARPSVPVRGSRPNVPAVNRPADANNADAPPAYEEAAKGQAYHPPLGSPLHPSSSTEGGNGFGSASTINSTNAGGSGIRPGNNRGRSRSSAYVENSAQHNRASHVGSGDLPSPAYDFTDGHMPGSYIHTGRGGHGQSAYMGSSNPALGSQRQRDRDRDCVVM